MVSLCLCMIRMRRSLNNGRTASTSGTSVETISVQSSPPESPVMAPRGDAATTSVRVSNAVPVPSAQTVRYRRHVNVTLKRRWCRASTEAISCCPVPTLFPCISRVWDCRHHAKWTQRTGPTFQEFPSCNEWFRRGGQNCNDGKDDVSVSADGGSNVVSGSGCARVSCG